MRYTAGQAAKATGVSTTTITRALKNGKISGIKDENGSWSIDPAELHRIFPPIAMQEHNEIDTQDNARQNTTSERPSETVSLQREIDLLKQALSDTREDRDRWRDMAERLSLSPPTKTTSPKTSSWWPW